ncbi:hypothetical protein F1D05_30030 [Kribbella qitaiheensis]|uniref:Right handed beta helix domain-containing protein n=1 Tax=Kribbella qitaiheensis TaxID=1544730 RepID=A0A7G6X571_9ACTN|nr:hypothetical protein [Kribbella qitaiheensis]QNE21386.1 hypothetical protein F1D05_30030 [Kribbella qitaiheensis]
MALTIMTSAAVVAAAQLTAAAPGQADVRAAIDYGTSGNGNPQTSDCTVDVDPGGSINDAISRVGSGAIVCVRAGDYRDQTVNLDKGGVVVRSNGISRIKGAVVRGKGATLDGFTVVGGDYNSPKSGIVFAGDGIKIVNNLVNGGKLIYGISCERGSCNNGLVAQNTVTGIESIGMFIEDGTGTVVERNNIYDLHKDRTGQGYDVDGIRFWGRHTFRYNYIHDINEFSSKDNPHTDCFQTYNNGTPSAGTLIENNYCLRVSRQCLIAQNNSASSYQIRDITFRDNVCETYDSQGINLGSMSGVVIENNLILSGFRYQIINLEEQAAHLANTNTTVRNNILVRAESRATTYRRSGGSTSEHFSNNLELLDTSIKTRDSEFNNSSGPYPERRSADFSSYRSYASARNIVDKGRTGNASATDIDGGPRVLGASIDIGPFEIR